MRGRIIVAGVAAMLASVANAYTPPLARTVKRNWPAEWRRKRPDAARQDAAQAKRERRYERNLRHVNAGGYR